MWTELVYLRTKLSDKYERKHENSVKRLIAKHAPAFSTDMLRLDLSDDHDSLHMDFLREAVTYGDRRFYERAMQYGPRHMSYPLLYSWDSLDTYLRKYVVYCFCTHRFDRPTLPLLPCSRLQFIDYLEWLPSNGISAGWESIRHYAGALLTWSRICGHGGIVAGDPEGYEVWQQNFSANVQIFKAPRGGDIPLRPWHLRRLVLAYPSDSPFDRMMRATFSQLWFTALRPGHFSPQSTSAEHTKHLMEWAHIRPYTATANGSSRRTNHIWVPSDKANQAQQSSSWTTATCCICQGADADAEARRALRLLCPTCSLEHWRRAAPASSPYVCCLPDGRPFLRQAFNAEMRRGLRIALDYLDEREREAIVKQLSLKSIRSGAATAVVTAGNAGLIAADFLHHGDPKITQKYYHKAGDQSKTSLAPDLSKGLMPEPRL